MKRGFATALIVSLLTAFVGCGHKDSESVGSAKPLTQVRLGYFPNVTHAQAVLGVSSGDFAAAVAPITLSPKVFNAGPALTEALLDGDIDVGYVGPGPVISAYARSHGDGIRVISGAASNGVLIVARKDSGIRTMNDLKGRRLATPQQGNTQDIAARHYLTASLGQTNTDNVIPIANSDQLAALSRHDIDAAWDPEPWGSILINSGDAVLVGEEKDLWPGKTFALTVIVTTPVFYHDHPDVLAKLLAINHQWTLKLQSDPTACIPPLEAALKVLNGKSLPPGVVEASLKHVQFSEDASPDSFKANAQWAVDLKLARLALEQTNLFAAPIAAK